jgi:hypothetical protein
MESCVNPKSATFKLLPQFLLYHKFNFEFPQNVNKTRSLPELARELFSGRICQIARELFSGSFPFHSFTNITKDYKFTPLESPASSNGVHLKFILNSSSIPHKL